MASISSPSASNFDELRWVINIRRSLSEELDEETEFPVSIFSVPKTLMSTDPESYTPQLVALGPYHYHRPELHEMERYKLAAAKTTQKHLHSVKFHNLVETLMRFEPRIRACYHMYLHFNGETLAWMMAIDASFLLEFLQIYNPKEGNTVSSRMSHLVVSIHRDIVMLDNQIPLFVLRKLLEIQYNSLESADDLLISMLNGLFKELSPFKTMSNSPKIDITNCAHILDYLHDMIVPNIDEEEEQCETNESRGYQTSESRVPSCLTQLQSESRNLFSKFKALLLSRPVRVILKFLPAFQILKELIEHSFYEEQERKPENNCGSYQNKPPLAEEIAIPSVVDLSKSGVRFIPTNGNISSVKFDTETATFHLPTVTLDINTKVVLRNLVAYEASNASGPLVFTRYTELMNGIIDTEEDVKLLSENGIVLNHLKSDEEGAELWNGMSKSIRLTKVPFLDKVIEDVNKYYNGRLNVKAREFIKRYVYGSWQFLTLLAATLLLILLTLQAFSSLYSCSRLRY